MMAPKFYNLFALMVMLLGLASAQSQTSSSAVSSAASKATTSASTASGSSTSKATTSSTGTPKKNSGLKATDPTLITVSLAAGLVTFGLALS